jgi:hypothetical protein
MVMLNCEYCGKEFNPARRFVQKFCSTSCRVLFKRHQGNRVSYQARKNEKPMLVEQPIINARMVIHSFFETYLGKLVEPQEISHLLIMKQLLVLGKENLNKTEQVIIGHIQRILQSIGQREVKFPQQTFRIKMNPEVVSQVERYLQQIKNLS